MHMRVVRFTEVDPERIAKLVSEISESEGPPDGVKSSGLQMVVDEDQRTAVVLQLFESADDLRASEAVLDGMDRAQTPGTRASIDRGEVKLDLKT